jgi:DNA-binding MarR family transcriptional regulator
METNLPPLKAHLGYWLRLVSNQVSGAFARKLAAKGVAVAEWAVMRELHDRDRPPSEIAQALQFTRGGITKLVNRLHARKLVARGRNARDGRGRTLSLTPAGRTLVRQLALLADRNDAEFFAALGAREREQFLRLLRRIADRQRISDTIPTQ